MFWALKIRIRVAEMCRITDLYHTLGAEGASCLNYRLWDMSTEVILFGSHFD